MDDKKKFAELSDDDLDAVTGGLDMSNEEAKEKFKKLIGNSEDK